jgi:hypothetical protein
MGILKVFARAKNQQLAISEVTFNELCAHHENRLRRAYLKKRKASSELAALQEISGEPRKYWRPDSTDAPERQIKRLSNSYQAKIRAAFEVIPLDGGSAIEALRREAWRIAPASTNFEAKGTGARDAAIWLSLVMESTRLSEEIFLVSADKRAFTSPALLADAPHPGGRVVVVSDLGELLGALAETVQMSFDIMAILHSNDFAEKLHSHLEKADILFSAIRTATDPAGSSPSYIYEGILDFKFTRAEDVKSHAIMGGETWATGRMGCDVMMPARIQRTIDGSRDARWEVWTVYFHLVFTFIFKSAPKFEDAEILGIGSLSNIRGELGELRQMETPASGFDRRVHGASRIFL